jgi:predicted RNA-binding Zn-ribbon protein involved in translation (DUF1610 family)
MPRRPQPYRRKQRRCPECGIVRSASELPRIIDRGGRGLQYLCPGCGHVGPFWAFPEVDPPEGAGGGEPA